MRLQVEHARSVGAAYGDALFDSLTQDIFHLAEPTPTPMLGLKPTWVGYVKEGSDLVKARACIIKAAST